MRRWIPLAQLGAPSVHSHHKSLPVRPCKRALPRDHRNLNVTRTDESEVGMASTTTLGGGGSAGDTVSLSGSAFFSSRSSMIENRFMPIIANSQECSHVRLVPTRRHAACVRACCHLSPPRRALLRRMRARRLHPPPPRQPARRPRRRRTSEPPPLHHRTPPLPPLHHIKTRAPPLRASRRLSSRLAVPGPPPPPRPARSRLRSAAPTLSQSARTRTASCSPWAPPGRGPSCPSGRALP